MSSPSTLLATVTINTVKAIPTAASVIAISGELNCCQTRAIPREYALNKIILEIRVFINIIDIAATTKKVNNTKARRSYINFITFLPLD